MRAWMLACMPSWMPTIRYHIWYYIYIYIYIYMVPHDTPYLVACIQRAWYYHGSAVFPKCSLKYVTDRGVCCRQVQQLFSRLGHRAATPMQCVRCLRRRRLSWDVAVLRVCTLLQICTSCTHSGLVAKKNIDKDKEAPTPTKLHEI